MQENRPFLAIGLMLLAVLCFATLDATSKTLVQTFDVPLMVWIRYVVHFILMLVFLWPSMRMRLIVTRRPLMQISRALMLVGTTGFAMVAFRSMPLAEATAIIFATPLAVALLAGPVLGERLGKVRWIAILVGFVGVLLVARPGGAGTPEGIEWALATAACYTVYQLQTRMLSPSENTWTMLFYTALVGSIAMTLALPTFRPMPQPTLHQALMLASLGVYGGTGHFLLIRAFRYAPASTLSPFLYVQLVWATFYGWAIYDHIPDGISIAGMAIVAISSIAMAAFERRR